VGDVVDGYSREWGQYEPCLTAVRLELGDVVDVFNR
jgi:hypothetical protein